MRPPIHPAHPACAETLPGFPNLGRHVSEANRDDIREIVFQGYRIINQTTVDHVLVLTVLHSSRDLSKPSNQQSWEG